MKSNVSPKLFLTAIALSLIVLTGLSAKPALAIDLPDLNPMRFVADNMDNWLSNTIVGLVNKTAVTAIIGCPLDSIFTGGQMIPPTMNPSTGVMTVDPRIQQCIGNSIVSKTGGQASAMPASLLGVALTLGVEAPKRTDAYPVNLAVYINDLKHDSIITPKEAYAGTDWENVFLGGTILGLWKQLRNLAYVLFVIMLVAFGFMVMFRYKINPQTVITVQEALPRVVVNLLLITFSFPIGALALHLAGVFCGMAFSFVLSNVSSFSAMDIVADVTAMIVSTVIATVGTGGMGAIPLIIFFLIVAVAALLSIIAWVISFFTRTLRIMLMTAFAPLQFAFATIPGNEHLVTDWFKALLANMLALPAIFLMGMLGIEFIIYGGSISASGVSDPVLKMIVGFIGLFINGLIGLWLLWNSKNAPKYIEGALGVGGGWVPGQAPRTAGKK